MKRLFASLVFAAALTGADFPARAGSGAHEAHGDHGDQGAMHQGAMEANGVHKPMFTEVSKRVLTAKFYRADVKLLDGRAHFQQLHSAHPGHAGIPTHRLTVDFKARSKGRVPKAALVEVVMPSGKVVQTDLWTEGGKLLADLELASTGSYTFKLAVKERSGKRTLRWSETLK